MNKTAVIGRVPPRDGKEWEPMCARCGSSCDWTDCEQCDGGYDGHDCGEDCCCCPFPEPNVLCDVCGGHGGWWGCMSSYERCMAHPKPGRENVLHDQVEWYQTEGTPHVD